MWNPLTGGGDKTSTDRGVADSEGGVSGRIVNALRNLVTPARMSAAHLDEAQAAAICGDNFLGSAAWQLACPLVAGEVIKVPPIPTVITRHLLESHCPFHEGQMIKDSHVLALILASRNGAPITPLRLADISRGKRVLDRLNSDVEWERMYFASIGLSRSQWVLMPKELSADSCGNARRLFGKTILEQDAVLAEYFPQYREVSVVEFFAAALLYRVTNDKPLGGAAYVRCNDESLKKGRICIGRCAPRGFRITTDDRAHWNHSNVGRALAIRL